MPRLAPEDLTLITEFKVKLRADVQAKIQAYGRYLNPSEPSSATYIITESFNALIAGDKEFAEFWKRSQSPNWTEPGHRRIRTRMASL
jgi:hypothetical protein